jgi:hypothetical protein
LKILRSETDKRRMVCAGNFLTSYRYRLIRLQLEELGTELRVRTSLPDGTLTLNFDLDLGAAPAEPPPGSPFTDWHTARRFAGPMPFTFSPEADGSFVVIEGSRTSWTPRPVVVRDWSVARFDEAPLRGTTPILANAFMVEGVDYRWERGRLVRPGGAA